MIIKRLGKATAVSLSLLLVSAGVVFADNFNNDATTDGNNSIETGQSTTITYKVVATGGSCDISSANPLNVTINAPSGVSVSVSSLQFTACGNAGAKTANFSSNTADDYSITHTLSAASGSFNNNANFTLSVTAPAPPPPPPPPSDTTAPSITPTITGTLGDNGWYTSNVDVSWTVVDNESAISSSSGCGSTTISADTAGTTLTCTATSAGGTNSKSVTIKRDATAPSASASASPAPNANGWNNTTVTVTFTGTDSLSGIASCTTAATLSTEGAGQSASGTCTDNAGNVSSQATASNINIDKTAPSVSLAGGPAHGDSYYFGSVPAAPTCNASDLLSGLPSGTISPSGYSNAVGTHTVSCSATDLAGNSNSASATYTVLPWTALGFYSPVDMNNIVNTVKGGSTVPLKFEVFAGLTELTSTSVVKGFAARETSCGDFADLSTDAIEITSTGSTSLRYDSTSGQFIQNWQTPKTTGKCYTATLVLQDGTTRSAFFKTK
ncbi:MAG: PxKF domain-containing protein [Chloroflexota bacterium]|nr:PxKF domain-containing protein [Chloroflexota bacterium]